MVLEAHSTDAPPKSLVQAAMEGILSQPAARLDPIARRQRCKAAMILECAEHGYAHAKVAAVAKRARVSTASLYRDFVDRDTLLLQSLELVIELFSLNWWQDTLEKDPVKRLEALLLAHGQFLVDPFSAWVFRLYVHLANTTAPHLLASARAARDANLVIWHNEIANLEAAGHLVITDHRVTVSLLLGAIERRSILARLAFGENDSHGPDLKDVAEHLALALFQVFGTQSFWGQCTKEPMSHKPAPGWVKNGRADHGLSQRKPGSVLASPSARLSAYGARILERDVNRLDNEGRKLRIQLAAIMECVDRGYDAATMAGVAARAGVSTATFYNEYPNKRELFIDAISLQARFRLEYKDLIDHKMDPADSIADMVYLIANVLADPGFLWFHRTSMVSEISDAPQLIQAARATRSHTEGFWRDYLTSLETSGFLHASDHGFTINLLLGATQRRSVLWMLFFGVDDDIEDELPNLALASTDFVLRLLKRVDPQSD